MRTGSAGPPANDAEPESNHGHDVHGDGGNDAHHHPNNERTAFHRSYTLTGYAASTSQSVPRRRPRRHGPASNLAPQHDGRSCNHVHGEAKRQSQKNAG